MLLEISNQALNEWLAGWSTTAPTTYQRSEELAFQRWFRFKEAFSPELVRVVIQQLPFKPNHIVDCCAGSGTTGMVSQLLGICSTLIEVNPFLADVIRAKVENYDNVDFIEGYSDFENKYKNIVVIYEELCQRLPPSFVEPGVKGRWLFFSDIAVEFEKIRLAINQLSDSKISRLFSIALASCLIPFSNVRIDGKGRRYRQGWHKRHFSAGMVFAEFKKTIYDMVRDIYAYNCYKQTKCNVILGDSRTEILSLEKPVDLFLFSPPYPNSFDYTDIYNVELWFMDYFKTANDNTIQRKKTMRSHVQVKWEEPQFFLESKSLTRTFVRLEKKKNELWDRKIPLMVQAYFEDLFILLDSMRERLADSGRIAIIVGDSSYASVHINTAKILGELVSGLGLCVELKKSERVMRASSQNSRKDRFLNEWLLILKKST